MSDRQWILVFGTLNAAAAIVAAAPGADIPSYVRLVAAAVAAGCGFALARLSSWEDAAPVAPH